MRKPIVACDMDSTLYDFVKPLLKRYNLVYNDNVQYEDITAWNIHQFLKPECQNIFKEFCNEGFFEDIVIPDCTLILLDILQSISDLYFVTAGSSYSIPWRSKLLKRNLQKYSKGWFTDDRLVKLSDKSLFRCDYIIDDNEETCNKSDAIAFLISKPWNNYQGTTIDKALYQIIKKIEKW